MNTDKLTTILGAISAMGKDGAAVCVTQGWLPAAGIMLIVSAMGSAAGGYFTNKRGTV